MIEQTTAANKSRASEIFTCPSNSRDVLPREVYCFMAAAFKIARWSPECNVMALVLVSRLQHDGCAITWKNWNKLILVALLISQKMWDDVPLTNTDFPQLWKMCAPKSSPLIIKELTRMEVIFLQLINWQTNVSRAVYTQFFYELSALSLESKLGQASGFRSRVLTDKQLVALEVKTQRANPSSHVLDVVYERQRDKGLRQPKTGGAPLRRLVQTSIKVLS
jgi:hypothetical protein